MADVRRIHPSYHGRIFYDYSDRTPRDLEPFRGRRQRPHVLRVTGAVDEFCNDIRKPTTTKKDKKHKSPRPLLQRSVSSGDQAKRFIRLVSPFKSSKEKTPADVERKERAQGHPRSRYHLPPPSILEPVEAARQLSQSDRSSSEENMRMAAASPRHSVSGGTMSSHATLADSVRTDSTVSAASSRVNSGLESSAFLGQKAVATGNGVAVFVTMAEPVIYLSGFENHDPSTRSTAMLRGNLLLRVSKTAKIKTVSMKFKGKAETDWPEGIPPKRTDFKDIYNIIDHTFSFYDCNMGNSEHHGAHTFIPVKGPGAPAEESLPAPTNAFEHFRKSGVFESITSTKERRHSLQSNHHRGSVGKADVGPNPAHKGYRTFTPGDYIYNFELPIDSRYPESIDVELGYVKYELEACVERAGAFRANLIGSKEVQLVRAPSGESLEAVEPIAISRDWEDQLHYDIVISGKSFPLGSQVPIAFKLTPLAKVQCHRIKVFITENIQYFTKDKKVHRMEPTRKLQLFEKRADSPSNSTFEGSSMRIISGGGVSYDDRDRAAHGHEDVRRDTTNLLGRLDEEYNVGPTEMELSVQLPSCFNMPEKDKNQRIHFDTTYSNVQVHHWIKIVMRLSKADPENPGKRRHFEISIDSPLNILSCRAAQNITALPSYTSADASGLPMDHTICGCPNAPRRQPVASNLVPPMPHSGSSSRNSPAASTADLAAGIAPPPAAHLAGASPLHTAVSAASSHSDLPATTGGAGGDAYDASRDHHRPMHLLRQPSFNPPSFDDSDPPPPLVTPPPQYESLVGPGDDPDRGLADYFQRLADEIDESDDGARWAGRLEIPLTPGGRVNRSMDEVRAWRPVVG